MIKPEEVSDNSLEELFGYSEQGRSDFEYLKDLVSYILFGQTPSARVKAYRELRKCGEDVRVDTAEEGEIVYAYLSWKDGVNRTPYHLVARYHKEFKVYLLVREGENESNVS